MSRIDELQKQYPGIPRDVILKHDVVVQGVRDGEDMDKVSDWTPGLNNYQSADFDGTLQEWAEKSPWRVKHGFMLRPLAIRFKSGLGTRIRLRSTSAYTVRELGEGKFALFEREEKVEEIYFHRSKPRTTPESVTSRGTPLSKLILFRGHCFVTNPVHVCEYFGLGKQCKFCNLNSSEEDARSIGLDRPFTINLEETVEAYKIRCSEGSPLVEGRFCMGGLMDYQKEARILRNFVEGIANADPHKPNLTVHVQAMDRKSLQRLKDAGLDVFAVQIEVLDPQMFLEICPGKAKHMPYEGWIDCIHDAVDIFGTGNVSVKVVPGITLFAPSGHKTWQEARDFEVEANRWIIKNGAIPTFSALHFAPGSVLSQQDPSYADKFPPTEFLLDVSLAHHEAMLESGLYDKLNKFLCCALCSSAGLYSGDIGMLTRAGDLGNWMADAVPDEANWLAKFVASVKAPVKTQ